VRTISRRRTPFLIPAAIALTLLLTATIAAAAGPPYPDPVSGQAVYDTAGVLRPETIARAESTIDGIEARTGAEVVVYTQLVPAGTSDADAERHAAALSDQWGIGRAGIDDGLVILFDLYENDPCHGRVQLYAGPGYRATYLSNSERQAIFENEIVPLLRGCDLDGALNVAMDAVDRNARPAHAGRLEMFRQLNAVLGLILAPLLLILLLGWGLLTWYRSGRDPVYLDDPSIHLPAPPRGLTPAAGALIRDGKVTRRALTAASLDLAVRGLIAFESTDKPGFLAGGTELGIRTVVHDNPDPKEQARVLWARQRPIDDATQFLQHRLAAIGAGEGYVGPDEMLKLGTDVAGFNKRLETHCVQQGWFRERPGSASGRWAGRAVLAGIAGAISIFAGLKLPSDGLVVVGGALLVAAIGLAVLAVVMPSVTQDGAVIRAMLAAYRRTLEKTMAQARSMGEVVETAAIPLLESPDDAVAWGVALGLQDEVETVLKRTADDAHPGGHVGYMPLWYGSPSVGGTGSGTGAGGWAPGLMSSSPIPNFGGMMAALGTIGNSPASSGSGGAGGGGFSGGGSGGGGGGAGGGF